MPDLWGHRNVYTYGVENSEQRPPIDLDRYVKQARRIGRSIAIQSNYASQEDGEQDAAVFLLEYLARYPNASWLKARKRVIGHMWRLVSPVTREERRRQRV